MSKQKTRRKFSQSFKEDAVRLVLDDGRTLVSVSEGLGINVNMLSKWKQAYLARGSDAFPGKGRFHEKDEELRRLSRELKQVTQEREILKKALAFFSQHR